MLYFATFLGATVATSIIANLLSDISSDNKQPATSKDSITLEDWLKDLEKDSSILDIPTYTNKDVINEILLNLDNIIEIVYDEVKVKKKVIKKIKNKQIQKECRHLNKVVHNKIELNILSYVNKLKELSNNDEVQPDIIKKVLRKRLNILIKEYKAYINSQMNKLCSDTKYILF